MIKTETFYKMHERWIHQAWYDPKSVFRLVRITENKMYNFGVDCIWEDIITGYKSNHWDNTMRQLTTQELRDFKLSLIIQN